MLNGAEQNPTQSRTVPIPSTVKSDGPASARGRHTRRRRALIASLYLVVATLFGVAAAQAPVPAVTVSSAVDLLGSTVTLTASFDNASTTSTDVGYGPY